jgi:hypothetical protein
MMRMAGVATALGIAMTALVVAQGGGRPASPAGSSATQIGGAYTTAPGGAASYRGGQWIEITYGRPIKRGRDLWGAGADYGKTVLAGAPVWRAGANNTTTLKNEMPLVINGKTVAPGQYSVLIDLKPNAWTLILTTWPAQKTYDPNNTTELWGGFNYQPGKDVVRAPMTLTTLPFSVDQLAWEFVDMSNAGGKLAVMWDKQMAATAFTVGK